MIKGTSLAIGKGKKIFKSETFLLWQELSIIPLIVLGWRGFGNIFNLILAIISAVLLLVFYLQPTPRISKYVLNILLICAIAFVLRLIL
jgi:uncharacterized membrane-anchored protein YitT (DUF2179 family)